MYNVLTRQRLNWKDHISMISQKISKSCGIIYRIRNTFEIKSSRLIYYRLIYPYLTYCINVFSSTYRTNLKKLWTVQKRSVLALFATAQQPHSMDTLLSQKIIHLDKFIDLCTIRDISRATFEIPFRWLSITINPIIYQRWFFKLFQCRGFWELLPLQQFKKTYFE